MQTKEKAQKILERAISLLDDRYYSENEKWHEVNVKRYHDYISDDEREKIASEVSSFYNLGTDEQKLVLNEVNSYAENDSFYWDWIEQAREQVNYELTEKDMCGHEWHHIREHAWNKAPMVVFLGRSGGHACFSSSLEQYLYELENALTNYNDKVISARELREFVTLVNDICDEVEQVQTFINDYNKALSWHDEVKYRAEEYAGGVAHEIKERMLKHKEQIKKRVPLQYRTV